MRVLVVEDGLGSYVLPVVRAFGRAGWTVGLGGPLDNGRSSRSRWVRNRHWVPPAESDLEGFVAYTNLAIDTVGYDIVFGGDDAQVLALSANRDRLHARVPYAGHDAVVRAIDKLGLVEAAERAGIAVPRTVPADPVEIERVPLPVVVKARLHWTPGARADSSRVAVAACHDRESVRRQVRRIEASGGSAVLQEPVAGELMAFTALMDSGGRVTAASQQRALSLSPLWRTSMRAETVPIDAELADRVTDLLRDLRWFGLANLQFLRPPAGKPHLIDLNGRFYGSLALTLAAGVNLPVRWAALAMGDESMPRVEAPSGVRYQALEEDLRTVRHVHSGGLVSDLVAALRYAPGAAHSTLCLSDPVPTVRRMVGLVRTAASGQSTTPNDADDPRVLASSGP